MLNSKVLSCFSRAIMSMRLFFFIIIELPHSDHGLSVCVHRFKNVFELFHVKTSPRRQMEHLMKEKKAMSLFRSGDDMKNHFEHVGTVTDIHSMPRLRKFAQVYKVAQKLWWR